MLSFRIIHDIVEKLGEDSYDSLKDAFMKELDEYERTELADKGEEIDEKQYDNYRKNLSKSIDTFYSINGVTIKDNSSAGGYCSSDNKYEWEASLSHILLPSQRKRTSYQILRFDALIPLFKTYSKLPK